MPKKSVAKKATPIKRAAPKKKAEKRSVVIGAVEVPDIGSELCIRHIRWTPCLSNHSRYDSKIRECYVTTDRLAGALLRQHHEGNLSKDDLAEAFSNITNYTVQMTAETVES